jgi:transcriptional regulator with XRE-family HTH domain
MTKSKSEIDEYIGSRIRKARLSLHLSQELLAKALGVSFQQVQNYEKGTNGMSAVRLFAICRILNAPLESMFPPADSKDLPRSNTRSGLHNRASVSGEKQPCARPFISCYKQARAEHGAEAEER